MTADVTLEPVMNPKAAMAALAHLLGKSYEYEYEIDRSHGALLRYHQGIATGRCTDPVWRTVRRMIADSRAGNPLFQMPEHVATLVEDWNSFLEGLPERRTFALAINDPSRHRHKAARGLRYLSLARTEPPHYPDEAWELLHLLTRNPPLGNQARELHDRAGHHLERALIQAEYDRQPHLNWDDTQ